MKIEGTLDEILALTGGKAPKKPTQRSSSAGKASTTKPRRKGGGGGGLPKKYAKMGFKKGWREYKKTATYKRKKAKSKKKK